MGRGDGTGRDVRRTRFLGRSSGTPIARVRDGRSCRSAHSRGEPAGPENCETAGCVGAGGWIGRWVGTETGNGDGRDRKRRRFARRPTGGKKSKKKNQIKNTRKKIVQLTGTARHATTYGTHTPT